MGVYQAQVERDEDGRWSSWIDDLPGCAAWGDTFELALAVLADCRHRDVATTQIYAHVDRSEVRKAYLEHHPLARLTQPRLVI